MELPTRGQRTLKQLKFLLQMHILITQETNDEPKKKLQQRHDPNNSQNSAAILEVGVTGHNFTNKSTYMTHVL
jgi:hypothetical protein